MKFRATAAPPLSMCLFVCVWLTITICNTGVVTCACRWDGHYLLCDWLCGDGVVVCIIKTLFTFTFIVVLYVCARRAQTSTIQIHKHTNTNKHKTHTDTKRLSQRSSSLCLWSDIILFPFCSPSLPICYMVQRIYNAHMYEGVLTEWRGCNARACIHNNPPAPSQPLRLRG